MELQRTKTNLEKLAQGEEIVLLHDAVAVSAGLSFQGHQVFHNWSALYLICLLLRYWKFNILKLWKTGWFYQLTCQLSINIHGRIFFSFSCVGMARGFKTFFLLCCCGVWLSFQCMPISHKQTWMILSSYLRTEPYCLLPYFHFTT